ncbi:hypothetical protein F5Y15DRAFT_370028 [Xylariaceae sp. FL0016]|nr:hypothetical protein F5Y15DRAFT_370028 [Xylariaceae sp. FL0016]
MSLRNTLLVLQGMGALATTVPQCFNLAAHPASNLLDEQALVPCDPQAEVSNCCLESDLCMGNGLCLDLEEDNAFTIQGCTDQSWPEACLHGFRRSRAEIAQAYSYAWACRHSYKTPYCLGEDASCCADELNLVYLQQFSGIHYAGEPGQRPSEPDSDDGQPESPESKGGLEISDRIALGVGIGLPVLAIIVALGQWLFPGARLRFGLKRRAPRALDWPFARSGLELSDILPFRGSRYSQNSFRYDIDDADVTRYFDRADWSEDTDDRDFACDDSTWARRGSDSSWLMD